MKTYARSDISRRSGASARTHIRNIGSTISQSASLRMNCSSSRYASTPLTHPRRCTAKDVCVPSCAQLLVSCQTRWFPKTSITAYKRKKGACYPGVHNGSYHHVDHVQLFLRPRADICSCHAAGCQKGLVTFQELRAQPLRASICDRIRPGLFIPGTFNFGPTLLLYALSNSRRCSATEGPSEEGRNHGHRFDLLGHRNFLHARRPAHKPSKVPQQLIWHVQG